MYIQNSLYMILTTHQQDALEKFNLFLNSKDQVFILKGSAGTGKTTLVKKMIEQIEVKYRYRLMAPTGRAAFVFGERTGYEASTIHRGIYEIEKGLTPDGEGQMYFRLRSNEDIPLSTLFFIDEASMISSKHTENELFKFGSGFLLKDLFTFCGKRKIVFIGDYAQLPPVGENFSPALNAEYLEKHYNVSSVEVCLKEVVRQSSDSKILENANRIRDAIENQSYNTLYVEDGADTQKVDSIIAQYNSQTNDIDRNSIIVTYSNKQAVEYNQAVRSLYFKDIEQKVLPGELLIITQNNYANEVELFNGTIVKVLNASGNEAVEKHTVKFYTEERDENGKVVVETIDLLFRDVTILSPKNIPIKCFVLDNFIDSNDAHITKKLRQALYVDFKQRMYEIGITQSMPNYYENMKADKYFNALICKYGYAITCHKAQGGEWKNVYVDMSSPSGKMNVSYFRWCYTAITRASDNLWHFAAPDFNTLSEVNIAAVSSTDKISYYVPSGSNFLDWHYHRISGLCNNEGISCTENRKKSYQHLLNFKKGGDECTYQIWYNKNGYGAKRSIIKTTDDEFANKVVQIIELALIPEEPDFIFDSEFSKILYEHIREIATSMNISILNIKHEPWKEIYYFRTNPYESAVSFFYDKKGVYSTISPLSTGGEADELLNQLLDTFR